MPYFPVDDDMSFHPKVLAAGNEAIGVWTRAGALCKKFATGGFVSTEMAASLGPRKLALRLVDAGLWLAVEGGYSFHDWDHQAGNFDADTEKARRDADRLRARDRKRAQRDREKDGHSVGHADVTPVTPGDVTAEVRTPPFPVPSPRTDVTNPGPVSPEIPASDPTTDEVIRGEVKRLGVRNLERIERALARVVGTQQPLVALGVAEAVMRLSLTPVKSVEAYFETTCINSPNQVRSEWETVVADWSAAGAATKELAS